MNESTSPKDRHPADTEPRGQTGLGSARWFDWMGWPTVFVLAIWGAMTVAAILFVAQFGQNLPRNDDYFFLRQMQGFAGVPPLGWFWEQAAEHRMPLGRVLQWVTWLLGRGDLRLGQAVGVVSTAAMALLMLLVLKGGVARLDYADALIPILLLHLGHGAFFLFFFVSAKAATSVLIPLALLLLLRAGLAPTNRIALAAGLTCVLLPLSGSQGIAATPFAVTALTALIAVLWRAGRRPTAVYLAVAGLLATILFMAFFVGHTFAAFPRARSGDIGLAIRKTTLFWAGAFGPAAWKLRGVSQLGIGLFLLTTALVVVFKKPRQWLPVICTLCALGGTAATGVAVGVLRQAEGMPFYYYFAAANLGVIVYAIWRLWDFERLGASVRYALFLLGAAGLWYYGSEGRAAGREWRERAQSFEEDVGRGLPITALVARHRYALACPSITEAEFAEDLLFLRDCKVEPFTGIRDDEVYRDQPVAEPDVRLSDLERGGDRYVVVGANPRISIQLERLGKVAYVRFQFHPLSEVGYNRFSVLWRSGRTEDVGLDGCAAEARLLYNALKPGFMRQQTIWVGADTDRIVLLFANTAKEFKLSGLVLGLEQLPR